MQQLVRRTWRPQGGSLPRVLLPTVLLMLQLGMGRHQSATGQPQQPLLATPLSGDLVVSVDTVMELEHYLQLHKPKLNKAIFFSKMVSSSLCKKLANEYEGRVAFALVRCPHQFTSIVTISKTKNKFDKRETAKQ